jgi:hypothetical protein
MAAGGGFGESDLSRNKPPPYGLSKPGLLQHRPAFPGAQNGLHHRCNSLIL